MGYSGRVKVPRETCRKTLSARLRFTSSRADVAVQLSKFENALQRPGGKRQEEVTAVAERLQTVHLAAGQESDQR